MVGVNKVILVGNLGCDLEVCCMNFGDVVCNLFIVMLESWCDCQIGEKCEKMEWYCVVIFNENLVKVCENYLCKGFKVYVEGQLQICKWIDQNGQEKYFIEVVLQKFCGEL